MNHSLFARYSLLLAALTICCTGLSQEGSEEITLREALVVGPEGRFGRSVFVVDPIEQARVRGQLGRVVEGAIAAPSTNRRWAAIKADEQGWLKNDARLRGGYVAWSPTSASRRVMLLEARGHSVAVVNGAPRTGDPYNTNWHQLPVVVRAGQNEILFQVGRGRLKARLRSPRQPVMLSDRDTTLPHAFRGRSEKLWCSLMLINATEKPLRDLAIIARVAEGESLRTLVAPQLPLAIRKIPFQVSAKLDANFEAGDVIADIKLVRNKSQELVDRISLKIPIASEGDSHQRTFLSRIDGSVQYFGVTPATKPGGDQGRPGLLLTLHGAGVKGIRQARVYTPKEDLHVVAPTNRRPFGFDWEDWGRLDALEALQLAQEQLQVDPRRVYLSGHSMGGHGTWHLGATQPHRFAAIAPSAGWISFWSYGGKRRRTEASPATNLLDRASATSDTMALSSNLGALGVYVLHGDADNNVPVSQARTMRRHLGGFHPDFVYKEQPGAGHWWGNRCCDWPPLIDFLRSHRRPDDEAVSHVSFKTFNPAVASEHRWLQILQQRHSLSLSSVDLRLSTARKQLAGATVNVASLQLTLPQLAGQRLQFDLDGQRQLAVTIPASGVVYLNRSNDDVWKFGDKPAFTEKGPRRSGPFKEAFNQRMIFVYGTMGNAEANRWALNKARYDAETFWYRGNGAVEVIADDAFDAAATADRSVILYGNSVTNSAWKRLLGRSPIKAQRGKVEIGDRAIVGDDLAFYFVYPRPDSETALVGAVGGTGIVGMRAATRSRYFVSGIGFPDFLVVRADHLTTAEKAIEAVGFFGPKWQLESADLFVREKKP